MAQLGILLPSAYLITELWFVDVHGEPSSPDKSRTDGCSAITAAFQARQAVCLSTTMGQEDEPDFLLACLLTSMLLLGIFPGFPPCFLS